MKQLILILFTLILPFKLFSQKQVKSKLIDFEIRKIPSYCGYSKQYGLLKLILLEKTKKLNPGDTIFIYQMCPRELMEQYVGTYKSNEIYQLNLGKKIQRNNFQALKDLSYTSYKNKENTNFYHGWLEK